MVHSPAGRAPLLLPQRTEPLPQLTVPHSLPAQQSTHTPALPLKLRRRYRSPATTIITASVCAGAVGRAGARIGDVGVCVYAAVTDTALTRCAHAADTPQTVPQAAPSLSHVALQSASATQLPVLGSQTSPVVHVTPSQRAPCFQCYSHRSKPDPMQSPVMGSQTWFAGQTTSSHALETVTSMLPLLQPAAATAAARMTRQSLPFNMILRSKSASVSATIVHRRSFGGNNV